LLIWLNGKDTPIKPPKWVSTLPLLSLLWGKAGNEPISAITPQQKKEETNRKRRETTAQKNKKIKIAEQALALLETIYTWFFTNSKNKIDAQTTISVLENAFATAPNSLRDYLSRNQPTIEEEPARRSVRVAEIQQQKEVLDEPPVVSGGGGGSTKPPPPPHEAATTQKRPAPIEPPKTPFRPNNMADVMAENDRKRAKRLGYDLP
jgi:hypothetical protein